MESPEPEELPPPPPPPGELLQQTIPLGHEGLQPDVLPHPVGQLFGRQVCASTLLYEDNRPINKIENMVVTINFILYFLFLTNELFSNILNFFYHLRSTSCPIPNISIPMKFMSIGNRAAKNNAATALTATLFPSLIFSGSSVLSIMPA